MILFKPLTFGRPEKILILVILSLVGFVIAISSLPGVADWYRQLIATWTLWAIRYGYFGAFLSALIGCLTIVIIFPYTIIVVFLASTGLNPFWLGALTGIGSFFGEFSGYIIGRWGSGRFQRAKPAQFAALKRIVELRPSLIRWLLMFFSVTPLPDDVLFIPLGMLRYSIWKLTWPALIGKLVAGWVVTYAGRYVLQPIINQPPTSVGSILSQAGTLTATALVIYVVFKVDWTQTMHRLLKDEPIVEERTLA